jgi:hypothetical protein
MNLAFFTPAMNNVEIAENLFGSRFGCFTVLPLKTAYGVNHDWSSDDQCMEAFSLCGEMYGKRIDQLVDLNAIHWLVGDNNWHLIVFAGGYQNICYYGDITDADIVRLKLTYC